MCFLRHFDLKDDLVLCTKRPASFGDQIYSISHMKMHFRKKDICTWVYSQSFPLLLDR